MKGTDDKDPRAFHTTHHTNTHKPHASTLFPFLKTSEVLPEGERVKLAKNTVKELTLEACIGIGNWKTQKYVSNSQKLS